MGRKRTTEQHTGNVIPELANQYLWLEASVSRIVNTPSFAPEALPELASEFGNSEKLLIQNWQKKIQTLRDSGGIALWGAGAKGATFANLVDPQCSLIDCVVDLNPNKQNRFIPGTGHPIVNYKELTERGVISAVLMNPNYATENQELLRTAEMAVTLIA